MDTNDKYIGKMLDDRYEILEVIGEGGMAIVYRALDHRLNRDVAVKIMRDEMAAVPPPLLHGISRRRHALPPEYCRGV